MALLKTAFAAALALFLAAGPALAHGDHDHGLGPIAEAEMSLRLSQLLSDAGIGVEVAPDRAGFYILDADGQPHSLNDALTASISGAVRKFAACPPDVPCHEETWEQRSRFMDWFRNTALVRKMAPTWLGRLLAGETLWMRQVGPRFVAETVYWNSREWIMTRSLISGLISGVIGGAAEAVDVVVVHSFFGFGFCKVIWAAIARASDELNFMSMALGSQQVVDRGVRDRLRLAYANLVYSWRYGRAARVVYMERPNAQIARNSPEAQQMAESPLWIERTLYDTAFWYTTYFQNRLNAPLDPNASGDDGSASSANPFHESLQGALDPALSPAARVAKANGLKLFLTFRQKQIVEALYLGWSLDRESYRNARLAAIYLRKAINRFSYLLQSAAADETLDLAAATRVQANLRLWLDRSIDLAVALTDQATHFSDAAPAADLRLANLAGDGQRLVRDFWAADMLAPPTDAEIAALEDGFDADLFASAGIEVPREAPAATGRLRVDAASADAATCANCAIPHALQGQRAAFACRAFGVAQTGSR